MSKSVDFFRIDQEFSEQERQLRDMVRSFVEKEFMPHIAEHYERGSFPLEIVPQLGALGILGMKCEGYGCVGASNIDYGLACQ